MKTLSSLKHLLPVWLIGLLLLMPSSDAHAQLGDDLYLFGFFQGQYRYSSQPDIADQKTVSSFSLQQLNAFLMKDFNASFSAFVNAELTNSFATDRGWGSLRLEEAWVRYSHNSKFNVKVGLLVPEFNNLNEIKNRTPLLPYIFRPMAYESSFAGIFDLENFAPQQAYLQVNGALPLGQLRFNYAAYLGNNSTDFAAQETASTVTSGTDMSVAKLIGGRVGVRWGGIKAGASATRDERDVVYDLTEITGQPAEVLEQVGLPTAVDVGTVGRTRLGADFSFYRGDVFGEAEYIRVLNPTSEEQDARLTLANQVTQGLLMENLDAETYHALLGYNFTDRLFAYGLYNYIHDESVNAVYAAGTDIYGVGGGFRPVDGIVTKAQYNHTYIRENGFIDFSSNSLYLAVSVSF